MSGANILIVDDDPVVCEELALLLQNRGYPAESVQDTGSARRLAAEKNFSLVLVDLFLKDDSGADLIASLKENFPDLPVIMITGHASLDSAVEAMKKGAADYIVKPFQPEQLLSAVEGVLEKQRQRIMEIAVSLSHNINSPLLAIRGNVQFLLKKTPDPEMRQALLDTEKAALQISQCLEQIQSITSPVVSDYTRGVKMIDLEKSIKKEEEHGKNTGD